jgi:hypothetical protein
VAGMVDFVNPMISAAAGLGGWLSDRREREKRRNDFTTRQIAEFYGPLVSVRTEIWSRGELRDKIENIQDSAFISGLHDAAPMATDHISENTILPMLAVIRDESQIFADISMPLYRKMIETFRDRMWLAEAETRSYFPILIEFVDVWERHLRGTMPHDVLIEIEHTEKNLHPFYNHLESTHDRLQNLLAYRS